MLLAVRGEEYEQGKGFGERLDALTDFMFVGMLMCAILCVLHHPAENRPKRRRGTASLLSVNLETFPTTGSNDGSRGYLVYMSPSSRGRGHRSESAPVNAEMKQNVAFLLVGDAASLLERTRQ